VAGESVRMNLKRKNFRVPNRDIKIRLSELLFINTKTFQRLNHIKQLGLAYLVYPFALHTRASHCLDCLDMAQSFIEKLRMNVEQSTLLNEEEKKELLERLEKDIDSIRAAALLHDIMHIPFAHTLEDENNIFQRGDKSKRINLMIDKIKDELDKIDPASADLERLANYRTFSFSNSGEFKDAVKRDKDLLEDVRKILWTIALHDDIERKIRAEIEARTPKNQVFQKVKRSIEENLKVSILEAERYYIGDVIGNTISADLLSYILRDPEFTGIETKPGGWYRLLDYLEIVKDDVGRHRLTIKLTKNGEWRQDAFSTIIRILNVRYDLTEQVTYHHAKLSASAMLGKIAQLCSLSESNDLYEVGDEAFFKLLEKRIDDVKNGKIEDRTQEDAKGAKKLLESLRCRRLHKRFHVIHDKASPKGFNLSEKYSKPEDRLKLERKIERLGLTPGSVIIFCPAMGETLKEAETLVTYEKVKPDGTLEPITLPLNSSECLKFLSEKRGKTTAMKVENVELQYEDLWTLYVFVDPLIIPIYGWEIKRVLNEELGSNPSFDMSYLELIEEYKLSNEIAKKVIEMRVPELDKPEVFKKIPVAITQISGRDRKETNIEWIRANLESIVKTAKEMTREPKETQRTLL
jgi:HD superfamily phosphohydrolase